MSTNRLFTLFVAIVLMAVIALTIHEALATSAIVQADRKYDQIEQARLNKSLSSAHTAGKYDDRYDRMNTLPSADRSYDALESLRGERYGVVPQGSSLNDHTGYLNLSGYWSAVSQGSSLNDQSFHIPQTSNDRPVDRSFHTPQSSDYKPAAPREYWLGERYGVLP